MPLEPFPKRRSRRRLWPTLACGAVVILVAAYAALPVGWRHYEHLRGLEGLDMVTRTRQGIPGDPINFGLIGSRADIFCAFRAAGWAPANPVTLTSSLKIAGSVMLRRPYRAAPVSALYYEGRQEDLAFEMAAGRGARTRHHVRLWRVKAETTPADDPRPLWLASASFDKSVGVNHHTLRFTHHIDPDLDTERAFLADALAATGLTRVRFEISGEGPTVIGRNGGGDRYFTDGEVVIESLGDQCKAVPGPEPKSLPDPPRVHIKNQIWRFIRPVMRLFDAPPAN